MKQYKIIIAYDGSDFCGWQQQPDQQSVIQTLQDTFCTVFKKPIKLVGVSRTDAGVHALGQVATFKTDVQIEPNIMLHAWNNLLPSTIVIRTLQVVDGSFFLHNNIDYKLYHYYFSLERPLPFFHKYCWYVWYKADIEKLKKGLQFFVGTHDFRSFSTGDDRGDDTVRTIESIKLDYFKKYKMYRITVKGKKFLRYMIRRIVGACIEVAYRDDLSVECLPQALQKKNPRQTLLNAPPHGLMLRKIVYKKD